MKTMISKSVALAVLSALIFGCAEERPTINRVQPYALDKTHFVGQELQDAKDNPEFWTQATLIDVGYGAAQFGLFNSTFSQKLSRIRWQITEDYLFARLAYERIADSDGKGAGKATNDGQIVAAYKIEKHFDVARDYNPTTGEQLNVLNENTTDRPWYERKYMRVDWSKNAAVDTYDFDTLSMLGVYGGVKYEPMAYDITDPNDAHAPVFALEKSGYFDVTNKAFAKPQMIDLSHLGWGLDKLPACMLPSDFAGGTAPEGNCNPVELTVRQSFRKVEDHDFEPVHWDGYRFQAFGGFYTERHGYARNYGMSDAKWHRFLNHYQIWKRSHYYKDPEKMTGHVECFTPKTTPMGTNPHRDVNKDGTEDECKAAGRGAKCDTFRQRCTLPFAQRETVAVPWYFTQAESDEFFEPSAKAAHEWDVALRVAARAAQYAECNATGGKDCTKTFPIYFGQQDDNRDAVDLAWEIDACRNGLAYKGKDCDKLADSLGKTRRYDDAVISIAKMPEILTLCHSPVEANDPAACGEPRLPAGVTAKACAAARKSGDTAKLKTCNAALIARQGDLRYHKINVFHKPQTPSPWGIYADAEDPLTGETIAASVNVWGWVNDYLSQQYIDTMRYIKGELKTSDITEGEHVRKWVEAQSKAASGGALPRLTKAQLDQRVADFAGVTVDKMNLLKKATPQHVLNKAYAIKEKLTGVAAAADVLPSSRAVYTARRQAAAGSQFEAKLMTPMVQRQHGVQGLPLTPDVMRRVSPLAGGNPAVRRDLRNALQHALAERGTCMLHAHRAAAPFSLPGLADKLAAKFGSFNVKDPAAKQADRAEKMRRYLARRFHFSVVAHEMGHSVGLRHNFVSSSDAWQFRPQYWQLRTRNGTVTNQCADLSPDGNSCVGPRWFDPVTKEERDNLIWMWQHSTVMEYPGEIAQDMLGLGVWDFAAVKLLYGDVTTVGTDANAKVGGNPGKATLGKMDNFGGILGIRPGYFEPLANSLLFYHYSDMQKRLNLIGGCTNIPDPQKLYQPGTWSEAKDGKWDPVIDGYLVKVKGNWTRCKQQKVDYVPWNALRMPTTSETPGYYRGGPAIDKQGRIRMPYGFGTDRWADLGNLSVYRHDNGADAYEIFNFLITQQEVGHIFDNYRRGKETFSVAEAVDRTLTRYNAKIRDGAKGLGLMRNIYQELALNSGYDFASFWPSVTSLMLSENVVASSMVFDHFTRMLARPEVGDHYLPAGQTVLRSTNDDFSQGGTTLVKVPNGATGYYDAMGLGGKLVENKLAEDKGEYNAEYTINAGSYYEKLHTAMLMTESVDNFISDSRLDFVDPRYRSVSLADLFPDGYRRWLANYLTDDDEIKGPRLAADSSKKPLVDKEMYPTTPIGWTSWWGKNVEVCFPGEGTMICDAPTGPNKGSLKPKAPTDVAILDPQVGWEQQKFLIAWTMLYLPENEKSGWLDMMRVWEMGVNADPKFKNRIEFHDPNGRVFVAKTYGKETIFGKSVQKGIAARVLEQANIYLEAAYVTTGGDDLDNDGTPDWYIPAIDPKTGQPTVKYDPNIQHFGPLGPVSGRPGCNKTDNSTCTCSSNKACMRLKGYVSVPAYLREAVQAYKLGDPSERGVFK
jgi:hypothetical protein